LCVPPTAPPGVGNTSRDRSCQSIASRSSWNTPQCVLAALSPASYAEATSATSDDVGHTRPGSRQPATIPTHWQRFASRRITGGAAFTAGWGTTVDADTASLPSIPAVPGRLFRWRTGRQIRRTTVRSHTTEPFISPPHFARGAPTRSAASRRAPAPFTHGHAPAHWIALPSGADDRQSSPVRAPPRTTASQHTPIPLTHGRAPAHWTVRTVPTVGLARPTHLPTPVLSFIRLTRGARRCAGR
jgi:hypothetical protein